MYQKCLIVKLTLMSIGYFATITFLDTQLMVILYFVVIIELLLTVIHKVEEMKYEMLNNKSRVLEI